MENPNQIQCTLVCYGYLKKLISLILKIVNSHYDFHYIQKEITKMTLNSNQVKKTHLLQQ